MFGTSGVGSALFLAFVLSTATFAQDSVTTPPPEGANRSRQSAAPNSPLMPTDPAAILAVGSTLNGLSGPGISPWHIKATYQKFDTKGKLSGTGSYEEFWFADRNFKRTYTSPAFTQTDYATQRGLYRSGSKDWPGRQEAQVRMYLTAPIPPELGIANAQLKTESLDVGSARLRCVTLKAPQVFPVESAYCFEQDRPMLRVALSPDGMTQNLYNGVVQFQGHFVAREILVTYMQKPVLKIHVDEIGGLSGNDVTESNPPSDATGPMTGRIVVPEETMTSLLLAQVLPVYPVSAKQMHVEGTVILRITVGLDGRVKSADAISGPAGLRIAAADSVRQWMYRPFTLSGEPTEVETNVRMIFTLGG